jgi:hypothetical protein
LVKTKHSTIFADSFRNSGVLGKIDHEKNVPTIEPEAEKQAAVVPKVAGS